MMVVLQHCRLPSVMLCALALALNLIMVAVIWVKNNIFHSKEVSLAFVGISNALNCLVGSVLIPLRDMNMIESFPGNYISLSISLAMTLVQLQANIALAYDRYFAVSRPFQYKLEITKRVLQRRLMAGNFTSIVVGFGMGYVLLKVDYEPSFFRAGGSTRSAGSLILSMIYFKVYRQYKASQRRLFASQPTGMLQQNVLKLRAARQKNLLKICFGISCSFVVFNSPMSIYMLAYPKIQNSCTELQGSLFAFVQSFALINLVFDPAWYLCRRRQRVTVAHFSI